MHAQALCETSACCVVRARDSSGLRLMVNNDGVGGFPSCSLYIWAALTITGVVTQCDATPLRVRRLGESIQYAPSCFHACVRCREASESEARTLGPYRAYGTCMPALTAGRSPVRSSHACGVKRVHGQRRVIVIRQGSPASQCSAAHLDVRPLVHALDACEPVGVDPGSAYVHATSATVAWTRLAMRSKYSWTYHGYAFMSAMLYVPRPGPASQSRPSSRMSSTPYSRFVSSR